ncbi:MAG TPA: class I SAM-dependent methyltransferase [Candidatus Hydrogenedentes bacterium]|nr:class I SAM-dependent methyltransferase [Candidatus Hydrogenedentota bacterium]HPG67866.1 class I SAM-dependent methyltransferase [Candidatus Hydrogenedentota bacterium]
MTDYDSWAKFYDTVHQGLPGEAEFYIGNAVRIGGPTLEVGCGTGRIAIPMAMSGLSVVGLDNSIAMLDRCRKKLAAVGPVAGSLRLVEADMIAFDLGESFDFIAMAYRTFMHVLTRPEQHRCLECIRHHLNAEGLFVLNTWVPRLSRLTGAVAGPLAGMMRLVGQYPWAGTAVTLLHEQAASADIERQLLHEEHRFREVDSKGTVLSEENLSFTRAWITPDDLERLVRQCGFRTEAVFGDFNCTPFCDSSDEMIWLLKKR